MEGTGAEEEAAVFGLAAAEREEVHMRSFMHWSSDFNDRILRIKLCREEEKSILRNSSGSLLISDRLRDLVFLARNGWYWRVSSPSGSYPSGQIGDLGLGG